MDISILSLHDDIGEVDSSMLFVLSALVDDPISDSPMLFLEVVDDDDDDIAKVESVGDIRWKELVDLNDENEDDCNGKADR